jgi:hypothetical protein
MAIFCSIAPQHPNYCQNMGYSIIHSSNEVVAHAVAVRKTLMNSLISGTTGGHVEGFWCKFYEVCIFWLASTFADS